MAGTTRAPLLTLDAIEAYAVTINGASYRLHSVDSLSISAIKRIERQSNRLAVLWEIENPSDEEVHELEALVSSICALILDAPPDVHEGLTDVQRFQVYRVFQTLPGAMLLPPGQRTATTRSQKTGASTSRALRGSTAATPSGGSRKRLTRSSAPVS